MKINYQRTHDGALAGLACIATMFGGAKTYSYLRYLKAANKISDIKNLRDAVRFFEVYGGGYDMVAAGQIDGIPTLFESKCESLLIVHTHPWTPHLVTFDPLTGLKTFGLDNVQHLGIAGVGYRPAKPIKETLEFKPIATPYWYILSSFSSQARQSSSIQDAANYEELAYRYKIQDNPINDQDIWSAKCSLSSRDFRNAHHAIFRNIDPSAGHFRTTHSQRSGHHFLAPNLIEDAIDEICAIYEGDRELINAPDNTKYLERAVMYISDFNSVHPFINGNGRLLHSLLNFMLSHRNLQINDALLRKYKSSLYAGYHDAYLGNIRPLAKIFSEITTHSK
jgi:fido (protein-threonine AMPylation protein)